LPESSAAGQIAPHVLIGGIPIFQGGLDEAVAFCLDRMRAGQTTRIATANLDFLALARRNWQLKHHLRTSDLVVADGVPVMWLARLAGAAETKRVAGVDFVTSLCAAGGRNGGVRVALYGSTEPVAGAARVYLEASFPGVTVADVICPPFRPLTMPEQSEITSRLNASHADVVLVALGCPGQERFAAEFSPRVPGKTWLGVGGSFDFFAGRRKRAPRLAQRFALEWFVRLLQEPRRLAGRYLLRDFPELMRLVPAVLASRVGHRGVVSEPTLARPSVEPGHPE